MSKDKGDKIVIAARPAEPYKETFYTCYKCSQKLKLAFILCIHSDGPLCRKCGEKYEPTRIVPKKEANEIAEPKRKKKL